MSDEPEAVDETLEMGFRLPAAAAVVPGAEVPTETAALASEG